MTLQSDELESIRQFSEHTSFKVPYKMGAKFKNRDCIFASAYAFAKVDIRIRVRIRECSKMTFITLLILSVQ